MLYIKKKSGFGKARLVMAMFAFCLMAGGAYIAVLVAAPIAGPLTVMKPIDVKSLPTPVIDKNRVVIPKIGVNNTTVSAVSIVNTKKMGKKMSHWYKKPRAFFKNFIISR